MTQTEAVSFGFCVHTTSNRVFNSLARKNLAYEKSYILFINPSLIRFKEHTPQLWTWETDWRRNYNYTVWNPWRCEVLEFRFWVLMRRHFWKWHFKCFEFEIRLTSTSNLNAFHCDHWDHCDRWPRRCRFLPKGPVGHLPTCDPSARARCWNKMKQDAKHYSFSVHQWARLWESYEKTLEIFR